MNHTFQLPQEFTVFQSEVNLQSLRDWLQDKKSSIDAPLVFSAQHISEVDCTGLQMLAALSHSGQYWKLVDSSSTFSAACRDMGLTAWLDATQTPTPKEPA